MESKCSSVKVDFFFFYHRWDLCLETFQHFPHIAFEEDVCDLNPAQTVACAAFMVRVKKQDVKCVCVCVCEFHLLCH